MNNHRITEILGIHIHTMYTKTDRHPSYINVSFSGWIVTGFNIRQSGRFAIM